MRADPKSAIRDAGLAIPFAAKMRSVMRRFLPRLENVSTLVFGLLFLNGCAAFLVPETSDPNRKLEQYYWLMSQQPCRPIPAERINGEALELFKTRNDEIGMAEAYHAFGNLYKIYKNGCYHGQYEKYLLETVGSHEKAYERSKENFQKAAELYERHKDFMGVSKSYFGIGNVYAIQGNKQKACESYDESLRIYNQGKNENPNARMPILTGYKDMPEMVEVFKRKNSC